MAESVGKDPVELFGTERGPVIRERMQAVLVGGRPQTYETHFNLPVGSRWFRSIYQPIFDNQRQVTGVQVISQDITEQRKAEEALQNAERLESIGVLAGGIAHDFNNLLSGIFGYVDMARESADSGDCQHASRCLAKAMGVFDRARHLTQQLLTFSKGGAPLRKTQSLAEHVYKSVTFALSGSNVSPVFVVDPDAWLCDFDENQIGQVLDNIAINARQAMPLGGKLEVGLRNVDALHAPSGMQRANCVEVSIRDHGIGIAPEHVSRIFDPFFTTKSKGSGLGLATSYSIVKRHEGLITVDSELGKGSTFRVYLPASAAAEQPPPASVPASRFRGSGWVLVMDDEDFVRDLAAQLLGSMGYEVVCVQDGDEALARALDAVRNGRPFGIALLDLTVPGGSGGADTVAELKKASPGIRVIASSGYSEDPVMADPVAFGFDARLTKPYRREELVNVLRSVMGG
jgi:signal transduction histidine kinase/CheY-like chemotaxis protein